MFWEPYATKPSPYTHQNLRKDGPEIYRQGKAPKTSHKTSQNPKNVGKSGVQKMGPKPKTGIFFANVWDGPGVIFSLLGRALKNKMFQLLIYMFGFTPTGLFIYLREFVYELPSSWPPARVEGGSGQQSMTPDNRDPWNNRDPRDPRIVPGHTLSAYWQVQDGFGRFWDRN